VAMRDDLIQMVKNYLNFNSISYRSDGYNVEYTSRIDCKLQQCTTRIICRDNGLLIRAVCPIKATNATVGNVVTYITKANWDRVGPHFEIDLSDGEIDAKQFFRLAETQWKFTAIGNALAWPVDFLKQHGDQLANILNASTAPAGGNTSDETSQLLARASSGDIQAANQLGWRYDRVLKDTKENAAAALRWYKVAADAGDKSCMYLVGCKYSSQRAGEENLPKAFEYFKRAADLHLAVACCSTGLCYKYGQGTEKNYERAVYYLREALNWDYKSQTGNLCALQDGFVPRAIYHLAECIENGWGCVCDKSEALSLYSEAAGYGFILAALKRDVLTGKISPIRNFAKEQDSEEHSIVKRLYGNEDTIKVLAENGDADAQFALAYDAYYSDDEDEDAAIHWATKAAKQGHVHAQYFLGDLYDTKRMHGDDEYSFQAYYWFKQAATNGHAKAKRCLADCYSNGYGVEEDEAEGVKLLREAATLGDEMAQDHLAHLYALGYMGLLPKDFTQTEYWYTRAIENNSRYALGRILSVDFLSTFYQRVDK